jgi:phospholipase A1
MNALFFASGRFAVCLALVAACAHAREVHAQQAGAPRTNSEDHFILTPHNPIYVLPFVYDRNLRRTDPGSQNGEVKFQLSFKFPVVPIPFTDGTVEFGYTQVSFWQVYNFKESSPFRETNYEPELMAAFVDNGSFLGMKNSRTAIGYVHQSNGQRVPLSRSWNRAYADVVLERGRFSLRLKPWYRFRESAKASTQDSAGDDNPDIIRYMGYGELILSYQFGSCEVSVLGRNNLRSGQNHGAVQIGVTGPIHDYLKWYVQYFNGHGESLIDYNRYSQRLGVGVMVKAWR